MIARKLVVAALLAACSFPAAAAVTVIGTNSARLCYQAADSPVQPDAADIARCDAAFQEEPLTSYEVVATHVNRGILRLRLNQIDRAIADFDEAIRLDPGQPEAYLNKGAALMRLQNMGEAATLFTASLERNTQRPELAHFGRAIANEGLGNTRAAYDDYRRAAELRPGWSEPLVELQRFRVVQAR